MLPRKQAAKASWVAAGGSSHTFDQAWERDQVEAAASEQRERREAARQHMRTISGI